ncbi:MAG: glycosyltransferase family 4 protein [Candidatus Dormibacteraeota bacterium]|nr:glycosyltransferase family 4 protein [Candidatus Dormibacteraeota bacterium]
MTSAVAGLRILALCDYFSTNPSGGSERAALELYSRLATQGTTVRVITTMLRRGQATPQIPGVDVLAMPSLDFAGPLRVQAGLSPSLFVRVKSIAAEFKPDVVHGHTLFFQSALAAAMLRRAAGVPLVTTVQIAGLENLREPVRALGRAYEQTVGRFIIARSDSLIAVSPSVRAHLMTLGADPARITVIPNGVDLTRFGTLARSSAPAQPPLVAFVGRLIQNKGPQTLVEALLELHRQQVPFKARFYGEGPMRDELVARARPAAGAIEFLGQVSEVAARLAEADILVRPSLTEGLPLAVLEAMASRVCVIATDIPGNRDLIRDGANGLLVPIRDPQRLATAIRAMIENPARRAALATAGQETAQAYSWDRVVTSTARVLTGVRRTEAAAA